MPPIGFLLGGIDFSNLVVTLKKTSETTEAVTLNYGVFINTVVDFLIISFAIFIVVKQLNGFKKKEEAKVAAPTEFLIEQAQSFVKSARILQLQSGQDAPGTERMLLVEPSRP